ncbi:proS, partial [Symbiodinium necroappetens]
LKPEQRIFMIGWLLQNTPEVVQWLTNRGEWFSAMTMLNFKAECQVQRDARKAASAGTKGQLSGKGRKHWSNAIFHSSWYSPYPFELSLNVVEAVAFVWDEYAEKVGADTEKVGDYTAATFQGKPAVAAPRDDVSMEAAADHTSQPKSPAPALSSFGPKGGGKASKGS